ncbi:MAG: DUF695 domain-containing protein [Acidobacteriota bacterium]|nr:DUF695 domain-containing protein [Acidobacteriota bacterium]
MSEETQESWLLAKGESEDGLPVYIRYREDLPDEDEFKKLKTLMLVTWAFESLDGTGEPTEDEADLMEDFESLMDESVVETGAARLMIVFNGEGVRKWFFYTTDEEVFMLRLNEALAGNPVLPLEIEAYEDENWDAYQDYTGVEVKK